MPEPARPVCAGCVAGAVAARWLTDVLADLGEPDPDALADIAKAYVDQPAPDLIEAARMQAAAQIEAWRRQLTPNPLEEPHG